MERIDTRFPCKPCAHKYPFMLCFMLYCCIVEENDPSNYLDQVDRGGNTGLHQGQIYWCIDNAEYHFTDGECLAYCTKQRNIELFKAS